MTTGPDNSVRVLLSKGSTPFDGTPLAPLAAAMNRNEFPAAARTPHADRRPPCHRCGAPAIAQWQQHSTDAQREGYWAAVEANIRAQPNLIDDQNATWTADRTEPVLRAVFGCEQHQVPDMTMVHAAECGGHGSCQCQPTP